jgi:hypothetical protein
VQSLVIDFRFFPESRPAVGKSPSPSPDDTTIADLLGSLFSYFAEVINNKLFTTSYSSSSFPFIQSDFFTGEDPIRTQDEENIATRRVGDRRKAERIPKFTVRPTTPKTTTSTTPPPPLNEVMGISNYCMNCLCEVSNSFFLFFPYSSLHLNGFEAEVLRGPCLCITRSFQLNHRRADYHIHINLSSPPSGSECYTCCNQQ